MVSTVLKESSSASNILMHALSVQTAKFVKPSLGDLPGALKGRLSDSNKKLIITTLDIIKCLSAAMGSGCSKFLRTFIPSVLSCLGDSNVSQQQYML